MTNCVCVCVCVYIYMKEYNVKGDIEEFLQFEFESNSTPKSLLVRKGLPLIYIILAEYLTGIGYPHTSLTLRATHVNHEFYRLVVGNILTMGGPICPTTTTRIGSNSQKLPHEMKVDLT